MYEFVKIIKVFTQILLGNYAGSCRSVNWSQFGRIFRETPVELHLYKLYRIMWDPGKSEIRESGWRVNLKIINLVRGVEVHSYHSVAFFYTFDACHFQFVNGIGSTVIVTVCHKLNFNFSSSFDIVSVSERWDHWWGQNDTIYQKCFLGA